MTFFKTDRDRGIQPSQFQEALIKAANNTQIKSAEDNEDQK